MKQILQNLGSGETLLADVPCPALRSGSLLLESRASLVSLGTEKMLVDFGKERLACEGAVAAGEGEAGAAEDPYGWVVCDGGCGEGEARSADSTGL